MANWRKAIVMGILCGLLPAGLTWSADPLPAVGQVDLRAFAGEGWLRATLLGKPVGYLHTLGKIRETDAGPRLETIETMSLKIDFGQGPQNLESTTVTDYGADLKPLSYHVTQDEFGRPKTVDAVVQDGVLHVKTTGGDTAHEKTLPIGPNFGSELAFTVALAHGAIPDTAEFDFQAFEPQLELMVDLHVACLGRDRVKVDGQDVDALKVAFTEKKLPIDMRWWVSPTGDLVRMEMPALMGLVLEKVSEKEALAITAPMLLSDHIAVARQMGDTRGLTYVRLKASSTGVPAAELVPETPLQHVAAKGERDAEVEVKAETEEGLAGHSLPVSGVGLDEYRLPNDTIQCDDPGICAKAREIVGDEKDAWAAAKKLVKWVNRNMVAVDHDPRPSTAVECLAMMKGDCSEHGTLLCALARAVGIPSKLVTGVIYLRDGYYYHAWNELYVGRWVAVDSTWGESLADAGHLALASGSLTSESFAKTNLAAVRCMGALSLEVLDYRTK